jgi:protein SCO1
MTGLNHRLVPTLLVLVSCGVVLTLWACAPAKPPSQVLNGAAIEPATTLPALSFARTDGGTFSSADLQGRTSLFFFGYTHCADVCPLTLAQLQQVRRALGTDAKSMDMYFVTVDPGRDTLEWMRSYVGNFPGVVGLVGSDSQLALALQSFNVMAERRDLGNGDYAFDHTGATYLVNSAGKVQLAYPYGTHSDEIVSDLRELITVS